MKPTGRIIDNRNRRLIDVLTSLIDEHGYKSLEIATGYLYQSGWLQLNSMPTVESFRILSSNIVNKATAAAITTDSTLVLSEHRVVPVKFLLLPGFHKFHGKMFLLSGSSTAKPIGIVGSSNLTASGLGGSSARNFEVNWLVDDAQSVDELMAYYDQLWSEASTIDRVTLEVREEQGPPTELSFEELLPAILSNAHLLVTRMDSSCVQPYSMVANARYQLDATEEIISRLGKYGCCFLADDVGLGKTIMGSAVLKHYLALAPGEGVAIVVIGPSQVADQWLKHISTVVDEIAAERNLSRSELISRIQWIPYGVERAHDFAQIKGSLGSSLKLVIVDEAHRLRNKVQIYKELREILAQAPAAHCLFQTATPINNAFTDLLNPLELTLPPSFWRSHGIHDIKELLTKLTREFYSLDSSVLLDRLKRVVAHIMIRRDLDYIKKIYGEDELNQLNIPSVEQDPGIQHHLVSSNAFADDLYSALKDIKFYAYQITIAYNETDLERFKEIGANVAGILRTHLAKMILSSMAAAESTLGNILARSIAISSTDNGVTIGDLTSDFDEDLAETAASDRNQDVHVNAALLKQYRTLISADIEKLKDLLSLIQRHRRAYDMEKAELLTSLIGSAKPALIFTEYKASAQMLIEYFQKKGLRVFPGLPDQIVGNENLEQELLRLDPSEDSPLCHEPPSYDLYILTDRYSEGKNLHKCQQVIHYDLPWNPVRKMQRQGRIVRIGSPHERVALKTINVRLERLREFADPEAVLKERLEKLAAIFGSGKNRDLEQNGPGFVPYFTRLYATSMGAGDQAVSSLGRYGDQNDHRLLKKLWNDIEKSGYQQKVMNFLRDFDQRRTDHTLVLKGISTPIFGLHRLEGGVARIDWFELKDAMPVPFSFADSPLAACTGFEFVAPLPATLLDGLETVTVGAATGLAQTISGLNLALRRHANHRQQARIGALITELNVVKYQFTVTKIELYRTQAVKADCWDATEEILLRLKEEIASVTATRVHVITICSEAFYQMKGKSEEAA